MAAEETTKKKVFPGHSDESHPEIFNTIPPQISMELKPGQLNDEQLKQFFDQGFLIIESFFTEEELNPARKAVEELVDDLANRLYAARKIKNLYSEHGFNDRLTKIDSEYTGANIVLTKISVLPSAMADIWSNERALNLAEQILGTADISGSPVWNLRTKIPNNESTNIPWHQDVAYLDNRAYTTYQLTGWIPLVDTNAENGCMQMIRGGHKTGRIADHQCCAGGSSYVMMVEDDIKHKLECDSEMDIVTCPVPFGGILIFNNVIPHRSMTNLSNGIRWSLDFRWQHSKSNACFYDKKFCVPLRSSTDKDFKIDWQRFREINPTKRGLGNYGLEEDEFSTIMPGPWMHQWEIIHANKHTAALPPDGSANWADVIVVG